MSTDVDTIANGDINHSQTHAAVNVVESEAAYLHQRSGAIAAGLEVLAARLEAKGMDPVVVAAVYETMSAAEDVQSVSERLFALQQTVRGAMEAGGHDAVAAVAAGHDNLATDTSYYTNV